MECPTNHAYKVKVGPLFYCTSCRQYFVANPDVGKEYVQCELPPMTYTINEKRWAEIAPWNMIPFQKVQEYGWYTSFLKGSEYLIMPVFRNKVPVYFSARKIDDGPGPKYYYQKGTKKQYWLSHDFPSDIILIGEGVADAVYLSLLGSSVGILGSYYDGSLDVDLAGRNVYTVLDGDGAGIAASLSIAAHISKVAKTSKIVTLPKGVDPTDLPISKLKGYIFNA